MIKLCCLSLLSWCAFVSFLYAKTVNYVPEKSEQILVNPDIGIVDHQTINVKDNPYWSVPSYPETSVVYFRWYWEELEPERGVYNFDLIDKTIAEAAQLNKKVVIRFMTLAGTDETYYANSPRAGKKILGTPCWLKKELDSETHDVCADDNSYTMDYNDPIFQEHLKQFVQVMGQRYNANPNILRLDVGLVGTWGEWHLYSHATENYTTLGQNGYSYQGLNVYIDMMKKAFPNKMLTIDFGTVYDDFTGAATSQGLGWRADCLGNWDQGWNHMENAYPQTMDHIENTSDPLIQERWKRAPVDFEICYTMKDWAKQPDVYTVEKVQQTFQTALEQHASLFNLKSGEIPEIYRSSLDSFRKKLGYRFVLGKVSVTSNFKTKSNLTINSQWINEGVAPSYNNYPVVWRLVDSKGQVVAYFDTKNDIRAWLPAESLDEDAPIYTLNNVFTLPKNVSAGEYSLEVGLVMKDTNDAVVKLAINNDAVKNWYHLMPLNIK